MQKFFRVSFSCDISLSRFNEEINVLVSANDDGTSTHPVSDCNPDTAYYLLDGLLCEYFTVE